MSVFYLKKINVVHKDIACFLVLLFSLLASSNVTKHQSRIGCHCLLFGVIHEKERVFQDGPVSFCLLVALTHYSIVFLSLYLFFFTHKHPKYTWTRSFSSKLWWFGFFVYLLLLNIVIVAGLYFVCTSISAPRCTDRVVNYLDFTVFRPKYFNAYGFPSYWRKILVYGILSLLSLVLFYVLDVLEVNKSKAMVESARV